MPAPHLPRKDEGIMTIVLAIVVAAALLGGAYLYTNGKITIPGLTPQATEEPRVNPEPTSGYAVSVGEVNPGKEVMIDSVNLSESASVAVVKDGSQQVVLGKTELLTAGEHTNITIKLSSAIKDGDVIYVRLLDKNAKPIQSEGHVNIEVMKNVGMLMSHYENEY